MSIPTDFAAALNYVFGHEGGHSNHKQDRGGETQYGITERLARKHGWTRPMSELPKEKSAEICKLEFWDVNRLDMVAAVDIYVAIEVFEAGVNMGAKRPAMFLQRALNVANRRGKDYADIKVDGDIGGKTVAALGAHIAKRGRRNLLRMLNALQGAKYIAIAENNPTQEDFVNGWFNRVEAPTV